MFVCCECCVLSGRGLCDGLITRPEESYRLWRVVLCDQKTSRMSRLKPATGLCKIQPQDCNAKKTNKKTVWTELYWTLVKVLYSLYTFIFIPIFVTETNSIRCVKSLLSTGHSV
jgi:hypothetical protein